jgi:UDP-glucose 4-epimerase
LCGRLAAAGQARLGGTGAELRDWTHAGDVVRFLDTLSAQASTDVPVANGATGIGTPVREIARRVAAAFGLDEGAIAFSGESRAGDPFSLVGAPGGLAPFAATRTLDQGIADYVDWFRREGARP